MGTAASAKAKGTPVIYDNKQILEAATGRWGEVAHDVKPAVPYVIAVPESEETITISPLTRRRRKGLKAAQAAYLLVGAKLAEAEQEGNADQGTISKIQNLMSEAEITYDNQLFGSDEIREKVYDFFDDLDEVWWEAMYQDVHDQLVNRVEIPEDICSKCGQKIELEAGEEGKGAS